MKEGEVIKSISYNQHEILYNIMRLHNNGKAFDADFTYSIGNFYGKFKDDDGDEFEIPEPIHKFDVCPQTEDTVKIEPMGRIPLDDSSLESIVIDMPFIISPRDCKSIMEGEGKKNNLIFKRFSSFYPVSELLENYYHILNEAKRVLKNDGICVFKCQDTITGGHYLASMEYSWFIGECIGLELYDQFVLNARTRIKSGKIKKQEHARKYHSYFLVFKKSLKRKPKYLQFMDEDLRERLINGFIENNLKK